MVKEYFRCRFCHKLFPNTEEGELSTKEHQIWCEHSHFPTVVKWMRETPGLLVAVADSIESLTTIKDDVAVIRNDLAVIKRIVTRASQDWCFSWSARIERNIENRN